MSMDQFEKLSLDERKLALDGLKSYLGYSPTTHVPTINEFLESDEYLGKVTNKGKGVYSFWRDKLNEIYPTNLGSRYHTIYLASSTGTGKSLVADFICAYNACKLILMENPHQFYNILPTKPIEIFFYGATGRIISATKAPFINLILESPFFKRNLISSKGSTLIFKNKIKITSGTSVLSNVSRDIAVVRAEELHQEYRHGQNLLNVNSLEQRLKSRFELSNGIYYNCAMVLVSSPGDTSAASTAILNRALNDKSIYLVQAPQWDVLKDRRKYSSETFKVYIGSENTDAFLPDAEDVKYILDKNEGHLLMDVPVDYYKNFSNDIYVAIKDIAGIVSRNSFTYMPSIPVIRKIFIHDHDSMFNLSRIKLKFKDESRIMEYVNIDYLRKVIKKSRKHYIHIDIGVSGDYTGLSIVHIDRFKKTERINEITGAKVTTVDPIYKVDACIYISKANSGEEMPIFKLRDFIKDLKSSGMSLGRVSCDGYQSTQLLQELRYIGIKSKLISLDKTLNGYNTLKLSINDGRIEMKSDDDLVKELSHLLLVRRGVGYKVDHPSEFKDGTKGRKDKSDGLAGAIYSASMDKDNNFLLLDGFGVNENANVNLEDAVSVMNKNLADSGSDFRVVEDDFIM